MPKTCAEGRPLAAVAFVVDDLDVVGPVRVAEQIAGAVGRAVIDDHKLTAVHWQLSAEGVGNRPLERRELVEHGHQDRKGVGGGVGHRMRG